MAMNLGENRVLREFKVSIDSDGRVEGYMELVSVGRVNLEGKITELNDRALSNVKSLPLELHIRFKNPAEETENIVTGSPGFNTPKKYLEGKFKQPQKIKKIQIFKEQNFLHINALCDSPEYDWRAGGCLESMEVLESKNVQGVIAE